MNRHDVFASPTALAQLRPALPGLTLAVLTLLFGFGLGGIFGLNEDAIKSRLAASAAAVQVSVYEGDEAAAKAVVSKSWNYMQRAHLHAGGLGTAAVALILVVVLLGTTPRVTRAISLGLGIGGLGYSVFWMWAGFRAPGLGSTGAAKESLAWLAIPSDGLIMVALAAVALLCVLALLAPTGHPGGAAQDRVD
ncbi:MAG TPA: hypothetical protein VFV65_05910 [Gemmatimonadales bacterium]|nr:hypothetical protein [Gemmatimonadales bacterium]